jgi:hypothetical protein
LFGGNALLAQIQNSPSANFTYKVKLIEEFFERFNFDQNTFIVESLREKGIETTRESMLISLFNHHQDWDTLSINRFISEVTNLTSESYIEFADNDWFAQVNTTFLLQNKAINIDLLLTYSFDGDIGSKWTLVGAKSNKLFKVRVEKEPNPEVLPDTIDINKLIELDGSFIRPGSHSVNFLDFNRVFKPGNIWENMTPKNTPVDRVSYIFALIDYEILEFVQNNKISFYFLQIENWIFKVEYFNRDETNSGWLISDLIRVDKDEKALFKRQLLYGNQ